MTHRIPYRSQDTNRPVGFFQYLRSCMWIGAAACALLIPSVTPAAAPPGDPVAGTTTDKPASDTGANTPHAVFPVKTQTVENVEGGSVAHFSFQVRNEGKGDLNIGAVQPSCGCTIPAFDTVVAAGKTGTISADVHTQPLWGQVVKTLSVYSNDPVTPMETLYLVVKVTPAYSVTPGEMQNALYDDPKPISRTFVIHTDRKEPLVLGAPTLSGPVTATVEKDAVNKGSWLATLTLSPPSTGGDAMGQVDIPTNYPQIPPVHLTVVALGQKGISTSPPVLSFGVIASGTTSSHGTIGVYSRGSKFHILKVESDDPTLTAQFRGQPTSISWFDLIVSYGGAWKPGHHEGVLTVRTDSPMAPILKVPYKADVQ